MKYTDEWRAYVTRQARWVDFDNDYKTLDPTYMESVLWAFKTLYDKGLVYEGFRVLPYCWNDETPLSNHELRMDDDVYQIRQDPAVTVRLRARDRRAGCWSGRPRRGPCRATWRSRSARTSTTSWSSDDGRARTSWPRPGSRRTRVSFGEDASERIVQRLKGCELVGRRYTPPFTYFAGQPRTPTGCWPADFVTTEDGTGVVHKAPALR